MEVWRGVWNSWQGWLLTMLLVILSPAVDHFILRALRRRPSIEPATKIKLFVFVIVSQWTLAALAWLTVYRLGGNLAALGEQWGEPKTTFSVLAVIAVIVLLLGIFNRGRVSKMPPQRLRPLLERLKLVLPTSAAERPVYVVLAVTAGICEEILFRGWLVSFLAVGLGSVGAGVVLSSLLFGAAHFYQGWKAVPGTAVLGLLFAGLFVMTGSLLPGQMLHAWIDVKNGLSLGKVAEKLASEPT